MVRVGVIADTHGLLRPQAVAALRGCDMLIHAGDIGRPEVMAGLEARAPTVAIRGNVDRWADGLPDTRTVELAGRRIFVIHDLKTLDFDPAGAGMDVVIAGHSHKPLVRWEQGVLYLNPGSAGPRRFSLPVAVAHLHLGPAGVDATILPLELS